ncbi:MAG: helix-hairpin-helix domain-containing protein [Lachnospiraceae bacterium]|nr:helix-hairpin-helix domain-containing protein [Lachnospiraceae bacterium]
MRKKESIGWLVVLVLLSVWVLPGCGRQDGIFYETAQDAEAGDVISPGDASNLGKDGGSGILADGKADKASEAGADAGACDAAKTSCYVHICGAVRYPGVYEVPEGSRLYEVIVLAGGLCADACDHLVNQAQTVADGMQVYIPTVQEAQVGFSGENPSFGTEGQIGGEAESRDTRIDLNRATKEQLMTLPGVGETRAQAIIAYRETHGRFETIEELMEVSGIKQGVYDRLKEMIKV